MLMGFTDGILADRGIGHTSVGRISDDPVVTANFQSEWNERRNLGLYNLSQ